MRNLPFWVNSIVQYPLFEEMQSLIFSNTSFMIVFILTNLEIIIKLSNFPKQVLKSAEQTLRCLEHNKESLNYQTLGQYAIFKVFMMQQCAMRNFLYMITQGWYSQIPSGILLKKHFLIFSKSFMLHIVKQFIR